MRPPEVARRLSPSEFVRLCKAIDDKCKKPGTKFDIDSIVRLKGEDKVTIHVRCDNDRAFEVELNG